MTVRHESGINSAIYEPTDLELQFGYNIPRGGTVAFDVKSGDPVEYNMSGELYGQQVSGELAGWVQLGNKDSKTAVRAHIVATDDPMITYLALEVPDAPKQRRFRYHRLGENPVVLGRSAMVDHRELPDSVSRFHASVWQDPFSGKVMVRDEKSTNGTAVYQFKRQSPRGSVEPLARSATRQVDQITGEHEPGPVLDDPRVVSRIGVGAAARAAGSRVDRRPRRVAER